jgi:hypothetical protein
MEAFHGKGFALVFIAVVATVGDLDTVFIFFVGAGGGRTRMVDALPRQTRKSTATDPGRK